MQEVQIIPPGSQEETMIDLVKGGASITKIENEMIAQVAMTRPRSLEKVLTRAIQELELDPEFAEKQYYRIPYKSGDNTNWVEGLSIKAAMALARCYGNLTASARIIEEDDSSITIEGICIDFETMFRVSKPIRVSKFYKKRGTNRMVKWSEDRLPQVLAAGASKTVRNAILNVIPEHIQRRYWNRAKELASGGGNKKPFDKRTQAGRMVAAFEKLGVNQEALENHLGKQIGDITPGEIGDLRGIYNAIEQGQTTIYEAFGIGEPERESGDEPKDVSDIFGGQAE